MNNKKQEMEQEYTTVDAELKNMVDDIIRRQEEKTLFIPKNGNNYYRISNDLEIILQEFNKYGKYHLLDIVQANCFDKEIEAERARLALLEKIEEMEEYIARNKN